MQYRVHVVLFLVFCVVFCRSLFVLFILVIILSGLPTIYCFRLPLWYLQTYFFCQRITLKLPAQTFIMADTSAYTPNNSRILSYICMSPFDSYNSFQYKVRSSLSIPDVEISFSSYFFFSIYHEVVWFLW